MSGQDFLIPPEFLLSFLFPGQLLFLCLCLAPHSRTVFSTNTSFYSPYFPIVLSLISSPKILLSMPIRGPSSSVLSNIPLPVPPMFFLFLMHFHIPYFSSFPYFPFVQHFPSKNPLEHARSGSFLQHSSFPFPSLPYFPIIL